MLRRHLPLLFNKSHIDANMKTGTLRFNNGPGVPLRTSPVKTSPPSKFSGIIPTVLNNYLKHFNQRPNSYGKIHRLTVYVLKKTNNLVIRPLSVVAQKNGMKTKNIEAFRIVDIAFACFFIDDAD